MIDLASHLRSYFSVYDQFSSVLVDGHKLNLAIYGYLGKHNAKTRITFYTSALRDSISGIRDISDTIYSKRIDMMSASMLAEEIPNVPSDSDERLKEARGTIGLVPITTANAIGLEFGNLVLRAGIALDEWAYLSCQVLDKGNLKSHTFSKMAKSDFACEYPLFKSIERDFRWLDAHLITFRNKVLTHREYLSSDSMGWEVRGAALSFGAWNSPHSPDEEPYRAAARRAVAKIARKLGFVPKQDFDTDDELRHCLDRSVELSSDDRKTVRGIATKFGFYTESFHVYIETLARFLSSSMQIILERYTSDPGASNHS